MKTEQNSLTLLLVRKPKVFSSTEIGHIHTSIIWKLKPTLIFLLDETVLRDRYPVCGPGFCQPSRQDPAVSLRGSVETMESEIQQGLRRER